MGQEIFYCGGCKSLLRSRDLEKGGAVRSGDQVYCSACAVKSGISATPPPETPKPFLHDTPRPRTGGSTPRTPRAPLPPAGKSPAPLIAGVVGGLAVLLLLFALAFSGNSGKSTTRKEPALVETTEPSPPPPSLPPPPIREPRPDPRPAIKPADREASARRLIEEARMLPAEDLDGRLERAVRARLEADGTPAAEETRRFEEEARARVKERDEKRKAEWEARVKDALAAERYSEAVGILEAAKSPARIEETHLAAKAAWKDVEAKLAAARRRGADAEVKSLSARVETWGLAIYREELAKTLAQPVEVEPPAELLAYRKRWAEPWAAGPAFDYVSALKELEKPAPGAAKAEAAADLEAVRLAFDVVREAPALLQKAAKGQEIRLERFEEGRVRTELAGKLLRVGPHEILVWTGEEAVSVPIADLTPAAWGDLFRGRAAKKPTDARAAQLYCLLEGDAEGAARHSKEAVAPGPAGVAARLALDLRAPAEVDARKAFLEAEHSFHAGGAARLTSAPAYAALLKAHGSTSYARRAKGLIEDRMQEAQEVFLGADELGAGGLFVSSEALKGAACLTMSADAPAGRGSDNFVQLEIPAPGGDASPRCWVYAGGCCLEVLSFGVQAPELSGPNPRDAKESVVFEPGSAYALPAKVSTVSLKAKHSGHMGPKEASKWLWVNVPLPKYATPGARKIRLVADQQGFSIAYAWIGTGRPGPPREADLKEWERRRAEIDSLRSAAPVQTGSLLREWWLNVPGWKIPDLMTAPGFPDRPAGSGPITIFEGPSNFGESYGTRVRGYVHPPLSGPYVFFAATDDESELWLSTDESPAKRRRILAVTGAPKPRDWDSPSAARSGPIALKAGKRYYVELLHKEGEIDDHFAVGWQLPDGSMERPIPGNRLSPWSPRAPRSGFFRGININGPPLTIDGRPWEGKEAPQVTWNGQPFENQNVTLEPAVDGPKAQMLRSSVYNRGGLDVAVQVPNGRYQVYAYFWEDNASQTFDILLNGKTVRERYSSGSAGHWEKLGPWPVDVADGKIELRTTTGDANLSGLEIWRSGR